MDMNGNILGLKMESNGIRVLEPFDMSVKYSNASGKTNLHLLVSEIYMNFSFSILRLILTVEEEITAFLRMSSKKLSLLCNQFDKVATMQGAA
jgi:vacuolar protein sorting-associated protein 13A/C